MVSEHDRPGVLNQTARNCALRTSSAKENRDAHGGKTQGVLSKKQEEERISFLLFLELTAWMEKKF
jgi:hypothetical protein